MKKYLLFASVLLAFASCANDNYLGTEDEQRLAQGEKPITFGFDVPAATRADNTGATAATALGNYFIVYGEKGETTKAKYGAGNLVFPNYTVHYTTNSAYTTTSNTKDWEYVGETPISTTYVKMTDGTTPEAAPSEQTIKYWDYGAASYTFTAVSAKKEDIENGRVTILKNTVGTNNVYEKGYTITLAKTAPDVFPEVNKLYFADRKVITKSSGADRTAENAYGGNVTLRFRNLVSQIRAGVYETIPGYDITEIKFYMGDEEAKSSTISAFGAICPNTKTSEYEGVITVTYYTNTDGSIENQPKVTQSVTPATNLILGTNMSTISDATDNQLGKTAVAPTWDTDGGAFTQVFPQIDNATDLQLKCNYKLWNSITKEVITVTGATARIPAKYLQWKPNFKYTYLFKISDNTNGSSGTPGTDPAGLWPITFDALEVVAEDGKAEYITTVSEPSITTFGVKENKYVVDANEYTAGSDIYATIMDGSSVVDFTIGTNVNVYLATTTDAANFPITEASVAESLAETASGTKKITTTLLNDDATSTYFTAKPAKVDQVPGEDAVNKDIKALKLTGVKATTNTTALVVEYIKTAATYKSEAHTFADATELTAWMAANYTLYTDANCTTPATTANNTEVTYYRKAIGNPGVYAYKVIRVQ